jgi:metacaspase-1
MNRALLVGINKYPDAPLDGCVNDIEDMANFLVDQCHYKEKEIRLITDKRATTSAIKVRLAWLTRDLKAGDRIFFHYSGHGAQVPTRNPEGEVDGLDEVICPVDFDWEDNHMIRDKEFAKLFADVPSGVEFIWISDSCHSGDLSRALPPPRVHYRRFPVPADIRWRQVTFAKERKRQTFGFSRSVESLNVALISGCRSDQEAADAVFDGRFNGAMTYYLLKTLNSPSGLVMPLSKLVPTVVDNLSQNGYQQKPKVEGNPNIINKAFMKI